MSTGDGRKKTELAITIRNNQELTMKKAEKNEKDLIGLPELLQLVHCGHEVSVRMIIQEKLIR